ncbi:MAG: aldehyde dehydrogenase [Spirochaetia bacterium]
MSEKSELEKRLDHVIAEQDHVFRNGSTHSFGFRKAMLETLYKAIKEYEGKIIKALAADFYKPEFESYSTEVGIVLEEIRYHIKHLKKWMKPKKVSIGMAHFPSKGRILCEPYGRALIIAPWNYPFQLMMDPIIGALSAGNTIIAKPAHYSENTTDVIRQMLEDYFSESFIAVFTGGREVNQALLSRKHDYIFFTGSPFLGKIVMEAASKHLTPVTLELGGKSPCIVDETADIELAAKRITWGKFMNAGQTCVAPDYLYVHESVKDPLLAAMKNTVHEFYGPDPKNSHDYSRIINDKQYKALKDFLSEGKTVFGGEWDDSQRYIAPTVLEEVDPREDQVMCEEIFGPILPVLTFTDIQEVISFVSTRPSPLALYLFTSSKKIEKQVTESIRFGGGCVNDTIIHLADPKLPFGGVGNSGMGKYHGWYSFDTFSNKKSIVKKARWLDLPFRYPPYSKRNLSIVKKFLH